MLAGCIALTAVIMRLFPDIELSRYLHRELVERPARWMSNATRMDILYLVAVLVVFYTMGEMVTVVGTDFLLAYSWDLAFYLDVTTAGLAVAAVARLTRVAHFVTRQLPVSVGRVYRRAGRAVRSQRHRKPVRSANDEDGQVFALAA